MAAPVQPEPERVELSVLVPAYNEAATVEAALLGTPMITFYLEEARGRWTTILDADLEYDPASIAELVAPLRDGTADAVYGIRGFQAHSSYSFW